MSFAVPFDRLVDYSDYERRKWRDWIGASPARLDIAVQTAGRFPTVGALLDHIFLIERRHLARLEGATPPEATGIAAGDWQSLFEYGDLVRADLRRYVSEVDDAAGSETITFVLRGEDFSVRRQKLILHIVMHEVRHLAQIALAARQAGEGPPGEHDIVFCPEV
jgi:uncharacterized damage-inducible protein DinB